MACENIILPDGSRAIVCGRSRRTRLRCTACGQPAELLCDWKGRSARTCDAPVCARCTTSPAPGKDLCPTHAREWQAWQFRKGAA